MPTHRRDHAVVVGCSIAGLATAAVLARRFQRVTLLERHDAPEGITSIAPHGRYPHVLLEGGSTALERVVPGIMAELAAAGAPEATRDHLRWWADGWRVRKATDTGGRMLATRALLETTLRSRVTALPQVDVHHRATVAGLVTAGERVTGVRTTDGTLPADLVVDCSGRGSRAALWLSAIGLPEPPVTEIAVDLGYLGLLLRRGPNDFEGTRALVIQNLAPEITRLGIAMMVEDDRWVVLLGGYFGDAPPTDRAGYLAFARSLPVSDLAQLLERCEPIGEPLPYRFRSNRRVHFERMRLPEGFVVLGDAMCSFNPIYAQGMSVAVMQAECLGHALDRDRMRTVHRALAAVADRAWMIAAGGDLAYPQAVGKRSPFASVMSRYMRKVFRACTVDPHAVATLWSVTNLVEPPSALLGPSMVLRVLRAQRRAAPPLPGPPVLEAA